MGVTNVIHIPLGTDTNIFRPMHSRQEVLTCLGLPENTFLMLYVGRLAGMKNIPDYRHDESS
jgi:glycosyltransferase involved in cell wall biosynthesis